MWKKCEIFKREKRAYERNKNKPRRRNEILCALDHGCSGRWRLTRLVWRRFLSTSGSGLVHDLHPLAEVGDLVEGDVLLVDDLAVNVHQDARDCLVLGVPPAFHLKRGKNKVALTNRRTKKSPLKKTRRSLPWNNSWLLHKKKILFSF